MTDERVGLCATCVHARRVPHPRGGEAYWMCALSEVDPEFPRYPRLPVLACRGYKPQSSQKPEDV